MEGLPQSPTVTVYQLVKQTGMNFGPAGNAPTNYIGSGFYLTQQEAEHQRTMELLKDESNTTPGHRTRYHIFPLTVPNPAYRPDQNT